MILCCTGYATVFIGMPPVRQVYYYQLLGASRVEECKQRRLVFPCDVSFGDFLEANNYRHMPTFDPNNKLSYYVDEFVPYVNMKLIESLFKQRSSIRCNIKPLTQDDSTDVNTLFEYDPS